MEVWKIVDEFPEYEVSNLGRLRSINRTFTDSKGRKYHKKGQIIKLCQQIGKNNYVQVMASIRSSGKMHRVLVHRLVAKAFIPNPNNFAQVNHKDENTLNNCADNLEWCDSKYNCNYGTGIQRRSKSKSKPVAIYSEHHELIEVLCSGVQVAKKYKVSRGSVSASCHKHIRVKQYYFEFI